MEVKFAEHLLTKPESELLDFKKEFYHKSDKRKYNKEIRKDITAMANSTKYKGQSGYIVIGYCEQREALNDIDYQAVGDEAKIQNLVNDVVKPRVRFIIHKVSISNKRLLIIEVPYSAHKPHASEQGTVYIRVGSSTQKASSDQIDTMVENIFEKKDVLRPLLNYINSELPIEHQLNILKIERMFVEFPHLMIPTFSAFTKGGATYSNRNSDGELVTKSINSSGLKYLKEYEDISTAFHEHRIDEARKAFSKVDNKVVFDSEDFLTLGAAIYTKNKELQQAENMLKRALQLQPNNYWNNSKVAYIYCLMWENEKAAIYYEKAVSCFTGNSDEAEANLTQDYFYLAHTYQELKLNNFAKLKYKDFLERLSDPGLNIHNVDWSEWKELAIENISSL